MYTFTRFHRTMSRDDELNALNANFSQVENTSAELTPGTFKPYTATFSGWSSVAFSKTLSNRVGDMVTVFINVSGTSNAATTTISLPYKAADTAYAFTLNNDATTSYLGALEIDADGTTAISFRGASGNPQQPWTTSGLKTISGTFITYRAKE